MIGIYSRGQIADIEDASERLGVSKIELMENAGRAAFEVIMQRYNSDINSVLVVCGSGNNGGDGLVLARLLGEMDIDVTVLLANDEVKSESAKLMLSKLGNIRAVNYSDVVSELSELIKRADLVVDAIYGTGFHGEIDSHLTPLTECIASAYRKTVALDLPSGVECDSGRAAEKCVKATLTISFIAMKKCHVVYPSAEYCGETVVADIGVPDAAFPECNMYAVEDEDVSCLIGAARPAVCNKYDFGRALLVCGSYGMVGAAKIAASAAIRCGAGLVSVCTPRSVYPIVASGLSEAVFHPMEETQSGRLSKLCESELLFYTEKSDCTLIGCGMGCDADTRALVDSMVSMSNVPFVIDADGINCIAANINILRKRKVPTVLTPHMGEMSRLCGMACAEIAADPISVGRSFSSEYGVILVLKGPHTMIFAPDGMVYVNMSGNSGMATAGSGDMLAGMIAAFIAQGFDAATSAFVAVHIHGVAGDIAAKRFSERAMTPTDMIGCLCDVFLDYEKRNRVN